MSIRLICSDIDGTLLQYGRKELEGEIFEQIRELHRRGILFCPASGRQYTSLRKLFAPVADCSVFLCETACAFFGFLLKVGVGFHVVLDADPWRGDGIAVGKGEADGGDEEEGKPRKERRAGEELTSAAFSGDQEERAKVERKA